MSGLSPRLRKVVLALMVAGVAAAFVAFYAVRAPQRQTIAVGAAATSVAPGATSVPVKVAAPVDTVHRILFVGASYTAGIGAEPETNGYAYLTARALGWQGRYDAVPGSGYLNPGPPVDGRSVDNTFGTRLAHLPSGPPPNIVLLQGGRNDGAFPTAELRTAVTDTIATAHERFAHARVVLLGPIPASIPPSPEELRVAHVLREVAGVSNADFVDPIQEGWITSENERGYVGRVPAHPDNAGYAYIAKRLVENIDQLLGATSSSDATADH